MSFEIDKSAHKKAQKKSKMRNLAKDNTNPHEKAAAEKKAGGPKLIGEATTFSKWRKNAKSAMQKAVNRKSEVLKKPEKAQDAGAKARRKLQRREYTDKVSTIIPKELEDQKKWSGFKKLLD